MSELEELQKNLNYKIKAQDIGLASWKGSHGKPQKMFIPTKDYLLSSASGQQDDIKRRNEMMEDYMERQKTPAIIYDREGNPHEYKYHNIPPPDLFYDPVEILIPTERGFERSILNADDMVKYLEEIPEKLNEQATASARELEQLKTELIDTERRYKNFSDNLKNNIENEERQHEIEKERIIQNYPSKEWARLIRADRDDTRTRIRGLKDTKVGYADDVRDIKQAIDRHLHGERFFFNTMEENKAKIQKELKKNEDKVKTYAQALSNLNRGELNTSKNFNETDEEYLERLQEMASVPFVDRNSEMKALLREKERLRDNLKLIIRDDATISQVINGIFNNEPLIMYEINKFFPGFQEYFIKKYGVNNDKVNFKDIITEVTFYLKRSTDPQVLSGNVSNVKDVIPFQQRPVGIGEGYLSEGGIERDLEDILKEAEALALGKKPIKKVPSVGDLTGAEESEEEAEQGATSALSRVGVKLLDNDTLIEFTYGDKQIYIRYIGKIESKRVKIQAGKDRKSPEYEGPNFFYSLSGLKGSFYHIKGVGILHKIAHVLNIDYKSLLSQFNLSRWTEMKKNTILDFLRNLGLKSTTSPHFYYDGEPDGEGIVHNKQYDKGGTPLIGLGIKQAQDLPDKVPFGSNILFLKKLFLKNILSIQNKHNTKINGFNNVHVSDNFVKIIMNLLKGVNFTNSELQNLTNNEKLLLDNLLILSELNKKFVTGSSTSSLNQLKKDYEILIGEIEAGNNNDLLKKKLYNLLMRMVHFGALSQIQAHKHYKEILKSHF
jgi:hypothetical protein